MEKLTLERARDILKKHHSMSGLVEQAKRIVIADDERLQRIKEGDERAAARAKAAVEAKAKTDAAELARKTAADQAAREAQEAKAKADAEATQPNLNTKEVPFQ